MNDPHNREETIFEAVLQLPAEQRTAHLKRACGDNAALRQRLELLLKSHEQASGDFLEKPRALGPKQTMVVSVPPPAEELLGTMIGRYKLLEKVGEGGFGVVYVAEQREPVKRRIALKIIKLGMDTKQVVARFEVERQALAMMDHPNIAKVFDAGATETGRPYFVMELVRGIRITDYCDQNNLSTRERLELFAKVCQAIQHAHQKGIIHRDIKPSNILVTLHDGVPVPKVIDFGIAKATQGELSEHTVYTQLQQFIGTPAYMSPEQAEMSGLDIDTRSDIYALGVLLYELLTGKTPFDQKDLLSAGLEGMRRMIREREPQRPSTRVSSLQGEERTTTAKRHGLAAPKLVTLLQGDLDWIVMKCLEKDRTRRYETANGVAADLLRHLNNEPVSARPPSAAYRFQKLVRRNKFAVAATGAVAAALIIGLAVSTWMFFKERQAYQRAVAAEGKVIVESATHQRVAQFLQDMLKGVGPAVALGRDTTLLREILDKTAGNLSADLKDQPEVEAELRSTLGEIYLELARHDQAEEMLRASLALRQKLFGPEHAAVARSLSRLATALSRKGKLADAQTMQREALRMQQKLLGDNHRDALESMNNLAFYLFDEGKLPEAEAIHRDVLARQKRMMSSGDPDELVTLRGLANVLAEQGKLAEAEAACQEALALQRKLVGNEHPLVADQLTSLSRVFTLEGKSAEAETAVREALAMRRKFYGTESLPVAGSLEILSFALLDQRKFAEAETAQRESLALTRQQLGNDHVNVAKGLHNLANVVHIQGREAEAETIYREALAIWRKLFGNDHPEVGMALNQLCYLLSMQDKNVEAEAVARESLTIFEKNLPHDYRLFLARMLLGGSLLGQKKYTEAEPLLLSAYEGMKQREASFANSSSLRLKEAALCLVGLYQETGAPEKAAHWQKLADQENRPAR